MPDNVSLEPNGPKFIDVIKSEINRKAASLAGNVKVRKAVDYEKRALNRKLHRFNTR